MSHDDSADEFDDDFELTDDEFIDDEYVPFEIDVAVQVLDPAVDPVRIKSAVLEALEAEQVSTAVLSISVVGNADIHKLNREFLQHDYPTDVISFCLEHSNPPAPEEVPGPENNRGKDADIQGEIIVSAEMARDMAPAVGWSAEQELILYVIHGVLHICGYDDLVPEEQEIMRRRERAILHRLGIVQS